MELKAIFTIELICGCFLLCEAIPAIDDSEYDKMPKPDPTLVYAIGIYRHGTRGPLYFNYKTNPNKEISLHFPEGRGYLSKAGRNLMFNIGRALRARYNDFIDDNGTYDPKKTRFTSNAEKRNVESAILVTEAMFSKSLNMSDSLQNISDKQNILVNTKTKYFDKSYLVSSFPRDSFECPYFTKQFIYCIINKLELPHTEEDIELFAYLSENTGITFNSAVSFLNIWDRLECERLNGLDLPEWSKSVYPKKMLPLALDHVRQTIAGTQLMNDLATGRLFKEIHRLLNDVANNNGTHERVFLHATHENSIYQVLFKLNIKEPAKVEVGDVILIELHKIESNFYVKTYYYQPYYNDLRPLVIPGCATQCPLDQFCELTPELSHKQWTTLCHTPAKSILTFKQSVYNLFTFLIEILKWAI